MITENHQKEALSQAYATAIAGGAGLNFSFDRSFDYGVDGTFQDVTVVSRPNGDGEITQRRVESGYKLDFQLKATKNWRIDGSNISYPLEAKTYNDLVERNKVDAGSMYALPKVLLLLCLPEKPRDWMSVDHTCMTLRDCCYWYKIPGTELTTNTSRVTIKIPRVNIFNPDKLRELMDKCKVGAI